MYPQYFVASGWYFACKAPENKGCTRLDGGQGLPTLEMSWAVKTGSQTLDLSLCSPEVPTPEEDPPHEVEDAPLDLHDDLKCEMASKVENGGEYLVFFMN